MSLILTTSAASLLPGVRSASGNALVQSERGAAVCAIGAGVRLLDLAPTLRIRWTKARGQTIDDVQSPAVVAQCVAVA